MDDAPTVKQYKKLLELGAKLIPAQDAGKAPVLGASWWKKEVKERDIKNGKRFLLVPASLGLWVLDADSIIERSTQETVRDNVSLYELRELIQRCPLSAISSTTRGWHLFWLVDDLVEHFETHRSKKRSNPKSSACDYPKHRNMNGAIWARQGDQEYAVKFDVRCCNGYVRLLTRSGVRSIINCVIRNKKSRRLPEIIDLVDLRNEAKQREYKQLASTTTNTQRKQRKHAPQRKGTREQRHADNLNEYKTAATQSRHAALLRLATSSASIGIPVDRVIADFKPLVEARLGEPGFNVTRVRDEADRVLVNAARLGGEFFESRIFNSYGSSRPDVSDFD